MHNLEQNDKSSHAAWRMLANITKKDWRLGNWSPIEKL